MQSLGRDLSIVNSSFVVSLMRHVLCKRQEEMRKSSRKSNSSEISSTFAKIIQSHPVAVACR